MKLNYDTYYGIFKSRPNRFIAHVEVDGRPVVSHVPNTGRLRELLVPGAPVMLSHHAAGNRKTRYELRMVMKKGFWVSIDSHLPNALAYEAIVNDVIPELGGYDRIHKEVVYHDSRFDLQLTNKDRICYVEVKGVTLERDGWSYFPDAPTDRGRKHIDGLIRAVREGYKAALLFVVQFGQAAGFSPNRIMDPAFADKVKEAALSGVEVLSYRCVVTPDEVRITDKIPLMV